VPEVLNGGGEQLSRGGQEDRQLGLLEDAQGTRRPEHEKAERRAGRSGQQNAHAAGIEPTNPYHGLVGRRDRLRQRAPGGSLERYADHHVGKKLPHVGSAGPLLAQVANEPLQRGAEERRLVLEATRLEQQCSLGCHVLHLE
jgi:hypothetical protein